MSKWICRTAIAMAIAAVSGSVMAAENSGIFVNGEGAGSNFDISNLQNTNGSAAALRVGYMWSYDPFSWGIEGGYADLGKASGNIYYPAIDGNEHVTVKVHGEMLGGNFKQHFGQSGWFYSVRGGWFHSYSDARGTTAYGSAKFGTSGDGVYAGLGLGYDFNAHLGVSFNFDNYATRADGIINRSFNTNVYGGTIEYRF